jgi:hypothetical protein
MNSKKVIIRKDGKKLEIIYMNINENVIKLAWHMSFQGIEIK